MPKRTARYCSLPVELEVEEFRIALEDDLNIRRALSVTQNIEFYRYVISFKLEKSSV